MMFRRGATVLGLALLGWALCDATVVVGMSLTSLNNALVIHAILAPVYFASISLLYFLRFNYTSPLVTALAFIALVVAMDFFVVALLINRSLAMFASPLGAWIPFGSIFASTLLVGIYLRRGLRTARVQRSRIPSSWT